MKVRVTVGLVVVTCALGILCLTSFLFSDRVAPEITVPFAEMEYEEGADKKLLLEGVSAVDDIDGDVTTAVRIYDVSVMGDGDKALVTYAVYDSSYNLAKAYKVVGYVPKADKDAHMPDEDGEASEDDRVQSDESSDDEIPEGYDDPPLVSDGAPVMRLRTHEIQIMVGGYFYSMDYVDTAIDDKDSKNSLYEKMYMDGYYNTKKAGEYELTYYCVDSDGNVSNMAKLKMIVWE